MNLSVLENVIFKKTRKLYAHANIWL